MFSDNHIKPINTSGGENAEKRTVAAGGTHNKYCFEILGLLRYNSRQFVQPTLNS
jgi:hypothetical protein